MAGGLPPPPTRAANGDFAWTAWYNQLYTLLSTTGTVSWALVNKAGSSIGDIVNRNHGLLTSILGTGAHHVSSAEAGRITAIYQVNSKAGAPVAADIPAGMWAIYKDTSAGTIKVYANDGGVIKATAAFV
jgi:hypothetical protein